MTDTKKTEEKKMDIETFNTLNVQISGMLTTLNEYRDVDITAARKNLMDAGKKIAESYYRYTQENKEEK